MLGGLYGQSLALLTDLYQLTHGLRLWKPGMADEEAVFHLFFRRAAVRAAASPSPPGWRTAIEYLDELRFTADDLALPGAGCAATTARRCSSRPSSTTCARSSLRVDVDAVPEGTVVFPHEPLLRVQRPDRSGCSCSRRRCST